MRLEVYLWGGGVPYWVHVCVVRHEPVAAAAAAVVAAVKFWSPHIRLHVVCSWCCRGWETDVADLSLPTDWPCCPWMGRSDVLLAIGIYQRVFGI